MPLGIGITELLIVGVLALVVFGPKRLPEMGRSLGRGMREFKHSIAGRDDDQHDDTSDDPFELPSPRDEPAVAAVRSPVRSHLRDAS